MSIKCRHCHYEMTTFEFIGNITAEVFLLLKGETQTRSITESWNQFMAGFSNKIKTPCPMCKQIDWISSGVEQIPSVNVKKKSKGQVNAK